MAINLQGDIFDMATSTISNTSSGTSSISGLASGIDWQSIITQLKAVEHKPIDSVTSKQTDYQNQLKEWRSFNTNLLSLKTAANALSEPDDFAIFTSSMTSDNIDVDASNLLSISTSSTASPGSYSIKINNLATAQKLSSASFSSMTDALGSNYSGDIIINGKAITITDTDRLVDIRNRINNANSGSDPLGVSASIISYGANDYRLILTSDNTGSDGISLQNGSVNDLAQLFGWKDDGSVIKNSITGGVVSDKFSSSTQAIKTLLGLSSTQSGTIQVNGTSVAIDISADSLETIKTKINAVAGVSASIITKTEDSKTTYALQIEGTQTFVDDQNILETLGILANGVSDVAGTTSANAMTSSSDAISSTTLLSNIDGYTWTSGDSITISGTDHSGNSINTSFSITSSSTVQNLLDAVKSAFSAGGSNVSAHVTSDGKIEVDDLMTGASTLTVSLSSTITNGTLDWGAFSALSTVRKRELVVGQDASLTVDGSNVTSNDNSIDNVLTGVTLNLTKADLNTTVTLNVVRDVTTITDKIQTFVTSYNAVASYITEQQTYDATNKTTGGVLFGDGTLSSIKSQLTSLLVNPVSGVSSDFSILGLAGVNVDNKGQLNINSDTLNGFLNTNFNDIQQLFSTNGTTGSGSLEYMYSSNDTKAGTYIVNITQTASKNSSASNTAVSGTLGSDETLTITDGDNSANISLTSGMTISDIINAVNAELNATYTEKLTGSALVTSGGIAADSTATWDTVDGVNLVNGDTISFSGTTRTGSSVSGSYTITDTSTGSIQGLLSEISSTFGDNVSTFIDTSGRVVLMDTSDGSSKLSLAFDYSGTTNNVDIFGTVLTTNSGGQEGRYSMSITAANDGSDHLMLSNNTYGAGHSFTIGESTDTGLWSGSSSSPVTVNNGNDVAGTINGEAATGSGQILTGDSGAASTAGLSLKYTGLTTGNVGSIKFTAGVAELFDRVLFNITDTQEGYLAFKQTSLTDKITDMDKQITEMEAKLKIKMDVMTARFQAMELALSKFQSISSWLSGQLSAASSGWKE
jgi:flagellar hook-associated protein 2